MRLSAFLIITMLFAAGTVLAEDSRYIPAQTAFDHPDIQGTWFGASLTPLERPEQMPQLVVPDAQAQAMSQSILKQFPDNIDPQISFDNVTSLNRVRGEYRTSQIVMPDNGLIPFTEYGLKWVVWSKFREEHLYDHPEQLVKFDRCLEGLGMPPMRLFPVKIPHFIVQTPRHVMIYSEDPGGARIIPLNTKADPMAPRTWTGRSVGYWEGNTLVVNTARFRADFPTRFQIGRPVLVGANTTITEHFTLASEDELVYQYTVEDPDFYTQPWSGEFSFSKSDLPVYEYGCHEGNYAMGNMLRGNQKIQAEMPEPLDVVAMPVLK